MPGKRTFDEKKVLEKALHVFWKRGYTAAGIEELLTAMGIKRQSMYSWVGDKEGLYIACLKQYFEVYMQPILTLHKAPGSPIENLRNLMKSMADYTQTEDCKGCLLTNATSEFGPEEERVSKTLEEMESEVNEAFEKVLRKAKEAGEISERVDIAKTAKTLAVMKHGIMLAGKTGYNRKAAYDTIEMIDIILSQ